MEGLTNLRKQLEKIQNILLDIGSNIATPRDHSSDFKLQRASFDPNHITNLEKWIDSMDEQLPPLKNFILPVNKKFFNMNKTYINLLGRRRNWFIFACC